MCQQVKQRWFMYASISRHQVKQSYSEQSWGWYMYASTASSLDFGK